MAPVTRDEVMNIFRGASIWLTSSSKPEVTQMPINSRMNEIKGGNSQRMRTYDPQRYMQQG